MTPTVNDVELAGLARSMTFKLALAGMPSYLLSEVASMRFQAISFFLLVFLLVSLAVCGLWNRLRRDVPRLPVDCRVVVVCRPCRSGAVVLRLPIPCAETPVRAGA